MSDDVDHPTVGRFLDAAASLTRARVLMSTDPVGGLDQAARATTYVVKKLEERGLVRRVAGADDQRTVIGELTQTGRALIADVFPDHVEQLRRLMSGLSVADKDAATTLLRKLTMGASAHR